MSFYDKNFRLGILGGGQLGRMFIQEAINYNLNTYVLDPSPDAPCSSIATEFQCGDFKDYQTVLDFGSKVDVVTIEIEHVNVEALKKLQSMGKKVFPQPEVLEIVKDKGLQKEFYVKNNIPTAGFRLINNKKEIDQHLDEFPFMQKARTGGYDGKGVTPLRNSDDLNNAFDCPSVLEKMVPFEMEIAVTVARNENGDVETFPVVELDFNPEANLVEYLYSPARISDDIKEKARKIAIDTANAFNLVGLLAVEMFLTPDGEILVNEVAPRTHNSGHHTIEGNITSQFEQHLRSVLNLPLGKTDIVLPSVMINLLGEKGFSGPAVYDGLETVLKEPGVHVHLYGKTETKPFRKMGHTTCTGNNLEDALRKAKFVQKNLKVNA
ncbi:MAG: 5-(carboxyamino)imidazole ribonucleotide synthase [Crocinitomicaceae bacterium]|nr:5-(carboxyamino)imidazole ribonucleotide synthase [Crocinitomicaceae bacterium]|tara:strand:- start:852 stop:1991 length:1140 start_codon:yes stop_codon:yes gene_type:complete